MGIYRVGFWDHFRRLAGFKGREDRASFWPYAAFVFGLSMVGMFAVMVPTMADSMRKMQEFAAAHPDQATVTSGPAHYSISIEGNHPELMPDMGDMISAISIISLVAVLLYAAAVVRRLHDRGKSGFWGLMPVPFLIYSFVQMPRVFGTVAEGGQPNLGLFFSIFFSNMLYLVALITLIVFLAGNGDPEPNQYDVGE